MKRKVLCAFFLGAAVAFVPAAAFAQAILAAPQDVLDDYALLLAGRAPSALTSYAGKGSRRDTVEVVLFRQALELGGYAGQVVLEPLDSYERILKEVASGRAAASATSVWAADVEGKGFVVSSPLIAEGEYEVGVYALEGNERVLGATLDQLRGMTAVTNLAWAADVAALRSLGVQKIESAPTFAQIARMVAQGRGDFFLRSFKATPDLSSEAEGYRFLPVSGIKVSFPGSRVFVCAPTAEGRALAAALDRGLAVLRKKGAIRRAYTDAGFFSAAVEGWKIANPR